MDIASLVGFLLAIALIFGSIMTGNAPLSSFIDIPSGLVVVGGAIAAIMMCFPLKTIIGTPMIMKKVFLNKPEDLKKLIEDLVALADTARRDGLLALESKIDEITNVIVKSGLQMAVDGNDAETIEMTLRTEMETTYKRHKVGKSVMEQGGRFAPAYGMIGTLLGLIMMLSNMSDPSGIGAGMAVALITTLYGAIMANVIFQPWAEKLGSASSQEMFAMELAIRGVLAIQSGESPRSLEQRLITFLPPKQRPVAE
jgi:chemotaxis protein MotA